MSWHALIGGNATDQLHNKVCKRVQSMVKHKSRLEREKEVAEQQRKAEEAACAQKAKRKVVHTPGSWTKQVTSTHTFIIVTVNDSNSNSNSNNISHSDNNCNNNDCK